MTDLEVVQEYMSVLRYAGGVLRLPQLRRGAPNGRFRLV